MKKILWVAFLISGFASAQELDSVAVDTVEIEPPAHLIGIFVNGGVSYEASIPSSNFFGIIGVGVQYDRWSIGFSRYEFLGTIQSLVVFPNTFELDYRYAGVSLSYRFYGEKWFDLSAAASYNRGDMVWRNMEDGEDFLRSEFDLMKLYLTIELPKIRYIKPHFSGGYQKMNKLEITRVKNDNFSGLFVAAGIRIGYFNQ